MSHLDLAHETWGTQRDVALAASSRVPVLVTAATGRHRHACARFIHEASIRRARPFVSVSCGEQCEGVVWDYLAATSDGSDVSLLSTWVGKAKGGTLFVDDIEHMSDDLQGLFSAALGRALDASVDLHEVRIITGSRPKWPTDESRSFSDELFYRLNVLRVDCLPHAWAAAQPQLTDVERFLPAIHLDRRETATNAPRSARTR